MTGCGRSPRRDTVAREQPNIPAARLDDFLRHAGRAELGGTHLDADRDRHGKRQSQPG
jgi:hypothetical protein